MDDRNLAKDSRNLVNASHKLIEVCGGTSLIEEIFSLVCIDSTVRLFGFYLVDVASNICYLLILMPLAFSTFHLFLATIDLQKKWKISKDMV